MKRFGLVGFLTGIVLLAGAAGCAGPVLTPGSEAAAPATTAPASARGPAATGTAERAMQAPPGADGTRAATAIPSAAGAPVSSPPGTAVAGAQIPTPDDPALRQMIAQAREDLARRLGVSVESITAGAVIGQEFSADAFYCRTSKDRIARDDSPQVIAGRSILLSAAARRYEYHASDQAVVFCRSLP